MSSSARRSEAARRATASFLRCVGPRQGGRTVPSLVFAALGLSLLLLGSAASATGFGVTVERQQSLLFIGSDEGIPWIGLLGWQVAGNSSATKQASTNASAPSTASNRTFAVNAPLAGSYRFLVIVLELASNAAPSQEFSLWLAVNGSGGNLPGVAGEHFFETPPSVTSAAFLTLVFNLGSSSAAETVRAVTVVASACPSLGICP